MINPWRSEMPLLMIVLLVGIFIGKLFPHPLIVLLGMVALYLGYHLYHIRRLFNWIRSGKTNELPQGLGIWEEIYYLIFRLRRRNRRRKKQLIRMLERFRTATAALPDATVVLSPRDEIEWFNEAAGSLLGLRRQDVGQNIGNLIRFPKFAEHLRKGDYHKTVGIPSPIAESTQLDIRVVPYGEDLRLLVAQDVTQLRFMERVRTDFVANVSHELRTPLTVIRGTVESMIDQSDRLPAPFARGLHRMEEQTLRMQTLIDDLLTLTRLESPSHQITRNPINVPELLRSIVEEALLIPHESRPDLGLEIQTPKGLIGGEKEIRSAFTNLIENALKYCESEHSVTVSWKEDGQGVRLDVIDTGPGIPAEYLPRLTERFYRVDAGRGPGGTGLGLAIVKHVLARHDAEFQITSKVGKGSCFTCRFPQERVASIPQPQKA
jgi:two-component system phosphate regulon sensor histidine kinase PhoR